LTSGAPSPEFSGTLAHHHGSVHNRYGRQIRGAMVSQGLKSSAVRLVAIALAFGTAGCDSEWVAQRDRIRQAYTTPPTSYRSDIVAFMRTYLNDPTGVRDAMISEPAMRSIGGPDRYSVCLRYNARKSNGQYAGSKDSLVLFIDGRLDRVIDNPRELRDTCKDAAYQPFPELQRLQR
jgi:hypothetical protein